MQPQDSNNQNTNPTPPPTPVGPAPEPPMTPPVAPATPAPAPTPTPSPIPEPTPTPTPGPTFGTDASIPPTPPTKKVPTKKLIIGILGILVLVGLVVGIYSLFMTTGPKLSDYSGKSFSIRYPEGFEKKDEVESSVTFVEKGDVGTASRVGAAYEAFPEPIGQDEVDVQMAGYKEAMESNLTELYGETGVELTDAKVEATQFQGQNALQATAKVVRNGKETGTIKYILSVNITGSYILFVQADNSDPAVKEATDEILNSFAIKL